MSAVIFLSYAQSDSATANAVSGALKHAELPYARDIKDLVAGDNILEWMSQGIDAAAYLLLLVSEASMASRYVQAEWTAAFTKGVVIVPVRLDDTPLPTILSSLLHIDLQSDQHAGIERIVERFRDEGRQVHPQKMGGGDTVEFEPDILSLLTVQNVRRAALHCMDQTDFRSLLFDFNIRDSDISGDALSERIIILLDILRRDGCLDELMGFMGTEDRLKRCLTNYLRRRSS